MFESADVVASLCEVGVTRSVAKGLCAEHPAEAIRAQISAMPHRAARDHAAVLVQAIRDGWAPPASRLAADAEARSLAEERMGRQSARDLGRRRDEEEAARSAQLNAAFAALARDQRDAIEEQAKDAVRRTMAAAWGGCDRDWTVGINRSMLEAARREIVAGHWRPSMAGAASRPATAA